MTEPHQHIWSFLITGDRSAEQRCLNCLAIEWAQLPVDSGPFLVHRPDRNVPDELWCRPMTGSEEAHYCEMLELDGTAEN